tara:strand:+ start:6380 stop:6814 length:435 start_codon:yes stop_codon:yes gene_type:complete
MEEKEIKNLLFKECNLNKQEDLFTQKLKSGNNFTIIKKSGIEKIIAHLKIDVVIESHTTTKDHAAVKVIAMYNDYTVQSLGSANALNCLNKYYLEMAEKRAKSRAVLGVTKLGLFGFGNEEDIILPNKISSKKDVNEALNNIFD